MMKGAVLAVLMAGPALAQDGAQDWVALSGAGIVAALEDRRLNYPQATQVFYAGGRTLYDAGGPSWGNWTVQGDQYCSQWPPGDGWDCYDMQASSDGVTIRFLDGYGNTTTGTYAK